MELIGKYEISGKVGSGAFGHVYRARDPGVGRQVAIKMLDYSGDQHAIERFRAEASTTAKLVHRNIVTIYDYGDHEGNPFIVMELLEGETLATTISRLEDGSLELSLLSRLEILIQVAEGLEYAHQRSIVHRDIKPANLVCLPDGVVKILDFGIARLLGEATSRMTKVGETAGTVLYMAPEQFRGLDADVMTDLFAFGTICYELLTLVHPFAASDTAAIIYRVTTVDPDPLTEQIPDCPVRLDAILRRAIDKNRKVRYQSAGDIALDLKEIIVELSTGEAARLFAMAKIAASENRPDDARVLGRRALELDPVNAEIRKFRDDIREQLQSLAMQAETTEVLGRADGFLSSRKYNEAIEVLENAARSGHDDTRVTALLSEARRRQKARREGAVLIASARERLHSGQLDDAKHLAALAEEADQHNPEIPPLVSQIEAAIDLHARKQRIAAAIEEIDILRTAEQFDAALKLLEDTVAREGTAQELDQTQALVRSDREAWTKRKAEEEHTLRLSELAHELQQPDLSVLRLKTVCEELSRLSAAWPADRRDRTLLREAEERLKARQRQDDIDNVIEQVEINRASGDLETGWQILEAALARLGETPQLIPLHQSLRSELDAKRRKERLESIVSDSTRALSTGNWREALPALEVAEREFPEESIIAGLVDSARAMKAAAEKQAAIDQALEGARKLASEHCWTEALQVIEGCWAQYPDEPVLAQERASLEAGFSAEHERVLGLIAAIDNALRDREHTAAVLVARSGRSELPHRMELLEAEARAWRALRAREVRQAVEDATALIRAGNLSAADNYLQRAHEIFPGETTLQIVTAELNQRQAARTSANFEASRSDSETGLTAHSLANPDKTSSDSSSANSKER